MRRALFLVAAGLSLIFGVTRIVNFAHGSFYMFGIYASRTASRAASDIRRAASGSRCWPPRSSSPRSARSSKSWCCRRIYQAPELFHLLATFALVLIFRDAALWLWGPEDLFGPRAPHLAGAVELSFGHALPAYDIALIVIGPVVLLPALVCADAHALGHARARARPTTARCSARSASIRRGFSPACSSPARFSAGSGRRAARCRACRRISSLDLETIGNAFVVVVVGGMGSIPARSSPR